MENYVKFLIQKIICKPKHEYTKELLRLMPKIESIYN